MLGSLPDGHRKAVADLPRFLRAVFASKPLFRFLATALLLPIPYLGAGSASATPLSLAALVADDGEFESTNGALEFEDFSAYLIGSPDSDLARFLIVPLIDGFRLEVASGAFLPPGAELVLSYEVESEGEDEEHHRHGRHSSRDSAADAIRSMSLEILGTSVIEPFSARMTAFADDGEDDSPIGDLYASADPLGPLYAATDLTSPEREIHILARLVAGEGSGKYPASATFRGTEMRFSAQPIPEPSSLLFVAVGLLGLAMRPRLSPRP